MTTVFNFSVAYALLLQGYKLRRVMWMADQHIYMQQVPDEYGGYVSKVFEADATGINKLCPVFSATDITANDWTVVQDKVG